MGCCGFPRGMGHYFQEFRLVEVQQTFYKPPQLETAFRWRSQAPPDFEFVVKAWQLITHPPSSPTYRRAGVQVSPEAAQRYGFFRPTKEVREAWAWIEAVARALKARVVLFQCPPSFRPTEENMENMRRFFQQVDRAALIPVWEPRGKWERETIKSLCRELRLVHGVDPFLEGPVEGPLRYFRLHGGPGYRHRYSDEELRWLLGKCSGETYCLFNNLSMYEDSLRFSRLVAGSGPQATG